MTLNLGSFSLVGEDDVTAFLGVDLTVMSSADANRMSFLLNVSSQQICSFANRCFALASYSQTFDGVSTDCFIPREWPVKTVISLKFSSLGDFSQSTPEDATTYGVSSDGTSVDLLAGLTTPRGRATCLLEYVAGYDPIPHDLRYATLIQYQYLNKQAGSTQGNPMLGLKTISKMGEQQTKDVNVEKHGLCAEAIGIVEKYKRMEAPNMTMFQRIV